MRRKLYQRHPRERTLLDVDRSVYLPRVLWSVRRGFVLICRQSVSLALLPFKEKVTGSDPVRAADRGGK